MRGFGEFKAYTTRLLYDGKAKTFTQRVVANTNINRPAKKAPVVRRKKANKKPDRPIIIIKVLEDN
jgi:hypothetical protein